METSGANEQDDEYHGSGHRGIILEKHKGFRRICAVRHDRGMASGRRVLGLESSGRETEERRRI